MKGKSYLKQEDPRHLHRQQFFGLFFDVFLCVAFVTKFLSDVLKTSLVLSCRLPGSSLSLGRFNVNLMIFVIFGTPMTCRGFKRTSENTASDNKIRTDSTPRKRT